MKTKLALTFLAGGLALLGLPAVAPAQCIDFDLVLADGRPTPVTIPFNGAGTYARGVLFRAAPGRSYSVEVFGSTVISVFNVFMGAANDTSCQTTNAAGVRDITDIEPRAVGTSYPKRFSFKVTAPITDAFAPLFVTRIRNFSTTTSHTVTVTVTDTTLFNPLWSTSGSFETFYRFQNTTNATCNLNLVMKDNMGTVRADVNIAIPANSGSPTRSTGADDLAVPNDLSGTATITHDCPPGAIQVDGFVGVFGSTTVVLPIRIQSRTQVQ